jgi:hypothetical protein
MKPPIPESPSDVTDSWLNLALARTGLTQAQQIDLVRLGEEDSATGFVLRAHLTPAEGMTPDSVIVKLPRAHDGRNEIVRRFYRTEVSFYRELAGEAGVLIPRAYYIDLDEATADYVLILEDFPTLRTGKNDPGATPAEASTAIRTLARLHARWWMNTQLEPFSFLGRAPATLERLATAVEERISIFLDLFGDLIGKEERAVFKTLPTHVRPAVAPLLDPPFTLVHGDTSLKITIIGGTPEAPTLVLIDWQATGIGSSVTDVSGFIATCVRGAGAAGERRLLTEYHGELTTHGVTGYSFEQLEDHRRSVLVGFAKTAAFGSFSNSPAAPAIVRNNIEASRGIAQSLNLIDLLCSCTRPDGSHRPESVRSPLAPGARHVVRSKRWTTRHPPSPRSSRSSRSRSNTCRCCSYRGPANPRPACGRYRADCGIATSH